MTLSPCVDSRRIAAASPASVVTGIVYSPVSDKRTTERGSHIGGWREGSVQQSDRRASLNGVKRAPRSVARNVMTGHDVQPMPTADVAP
jgi:hypothetical protein